MGRKLGRPRAGEETLSREQIIATALRLIDAEGMQALSMRRLAGELGVDPMAIYHHLPNKQAVLAGVTELVFRDLQTPAGADGPWQDQVRAFARAYCALVLAHPNLTRHLIAAMPTGSPALLAANEALYAALVRAGLPPPQVVQAADLVVDYLHGWALAGDPGQGGRPGSPHGILTLLKPYPPERYPTMSRLLASLAGQERPGGPEEGLVFILAGIAQMARDAGCGPER